MAQVKREGPLDGGGAAEMRRRQALSKVKRSRDQNGAEKKRVHTSKRGPFTNQRTWVYGTEH